MLNEIVERVLASIALALINLNEERILKEYSDLFEEYFNISAEQNKKAEETYINLINTAPEYKNLKQIYKVCGENKLSAKLVELALVSYIHPRVVNLLVRVYGYAPCFEVCAQIWKEEAKNSPSLRKQYDMVRSLLVPEEMVNMPYFRRAFIADDRLFDFIGGDQTIDEKLKLFAEVVQPDSELQKLFVDEDIAKNIGGLLKGKYTVQIVGGEGRGKKLLFLHACKLISRTALLIDVKALFAEPEDMRSDLIIRIKREAMLLDYHLCFWNLKINDNLEPITVYHSLIAPAEKIGIPVCVCTSEEYHLISICKTPINLVDLPEHTRPERIALWRGYGAQYNISGVSWEIIGNKFKLSAKQIRKSMAMLQLNENNIVSEKDVSIACAMVLPPAHGNIRATKSIYTLDDLKISDENKEVMHNICSHVIHRHKVYDEWNMESRFAYGKNISALLAGAPGTGKTMAVHVLSTMLGIPIYQVDLSQVVDKYVGETEKHLEKIFDRAERSNTILFFDEADSVFGKRSEVSEAKDKYANTQVSYILQRIEQYDGLVILATNFRQNIDKAILRRIRYLVEFNMPNEETRKQIWESSFAKETPLEDIDFDYLARQFEFAGGTIKNIALNAVFLAAKEDSSVKMHHILLSLREENRKYGKSMMNTDFAEYGHTMDIQ